MPFSGSKTKAMSSGVLKSKILKAEALRLGFSHCGLAPAEPVDEAYMQHYEDWLRRGWHGDMHYLENHLALRRDPRLLLSGAKTVISLAMSYNPGLAETQPALAWYAQGRDYHEVVRARARRLLEKSLPGSPCQEGKGASTSRDGSFPDREGEGRVCVDTAPVLEKYWAWRCGLGWIGRHTQLVIPHEGSAFFLAEILMTVEADYYDEPQTHPGPPYKGGSRASGKNSLPKEGWGGSPCGTCHRCLDACPTRAITDEGLDARRCLSYLTIEHRGPLPPSIAPYLRECFYGCDRCLRACPHLSRSAASPVPDFLPSPALLAMTPTQWTQLSREDYQSLFRGSAVKRAKFEGLRRNIDLRAK